MHYAPKMHLYISSQSGVWIFWIFLLRNRWSGSFLHNAEALKCENNTFKIKITININHPHNCTKREVGQGVLLSFLHVCQMAAAVLDKGQSKQYSFAALYENQEGEMKCWRLLVAHSSKLLWKEISSEAIALSALWLPWLTDPGDQWPPPSGPLK